MKYVGRLFGYLILGVNLFLSGLLLFSAFSPYINPESHPILSCAGMAFPAFLLMNLLFLIFWLFVYRRYALVSFLTFIICISPIRTYMPLNFPTKEVSKEAFKLLSYNVMAFDGDKKHTKDDPNSILKYLQESNADVICLQEFIMGVDKHHLRKRDVDKVLEDYPYKVYHQIGTNENGLACYSKFPIIYSRRLEYESLYNGSAIYQLMVGKDTVCLINNHLESNKLTYEDKATYVDMIKSPEKSKVSRGVRLLISKLAEATEIRTRQAKKIADEINSLGQRSIIVCGDFNDTPISYTHRVISQDLNDAFVQSGNGIGVSYNQNGFYFRIDNILLSKNLKSYDCTVDNTIKDSDHYPIWCYIGKKE